ncbi:hypothetical protein QQP08_014484 [Theobroma cacao]|nr:hypothetical protein QQP08_014484 [Theobroma cacao]
MPEDYRVICSYYNGPWQSARQCYYHDGSSQLILEQMMGKYGLRTQNDVRRLAAICKRLIQLVKIHEEKHQTDRIVSSQAKN